MENKAEELMFFNVFKKLKNEINYMQDDSIEKEDKLRNMVQFLSIATHETPNKKPYQSALLSFYQKELRSLTNKTSEKREKHELVGSGSNGKLLKMDKEKLSFLFNTPSPSPSSLTSSEGNCMSDIGAMQNSKKQIGNHNSDIDSIRNSKKQLEVQNTHTSATKSMMDSSKQSTKYGNMEAFLKKPVAKIEDEENTIIYDTAVSASKRPSKYNSAPPLDNQAKRRHQQMQRNVFQTAAEKLEQGDEQEEKQSRKSINSRPNRGGYHPVNPQVLLRKNSYDDDSDIADDDDGSNGISTRAVRKKFIPPGKKNTQSKRKRSTTDTADNDNGQVDPNTDPRLKSCDPELVAKIEMEIIDRGDPVSFQDIAGLEFAKKCVNELVVWPMARPDIFTGLRSLPKGLLLFGPPGTGKTLIGKAIATESGATFFNISSSSLTSKWIGEGEKLVRTLFAVARVKQPSVVFIDEIDSLLTQRSSDDNEASRRIKTEFLVQLDGAGTKSNDIVIVVGATNRPQELDEAARRRFVKRLFIPLPCKEARLDMISNLLKSNLHELQPNDIEAIVSHAKWYSGADIRSLCTEAAMEPIRSCMTNDIRNINAEQIRAINKTDFEKALKCVRSSVSIKDLEQYHDWNEEYGSFQINKEQT